MSNIKADQAIPLDYAESDNAVEIDNGIRDTIKGIRLSILAMGAGLARIKSKGLYRDLKCRSMTEYIDRLGDDCNMESSGIFNWLQIGEAYLKYRSELESVGFCESDGPTKLPYLDRALAIREKQEVFDNIKKMSVREFHSFSKGEPAGPGTDAPFVSIRGNTVFIDGKQAIILCQNMGKRNLAYFKKVINAACEALEEGGVILLVPLNDMKEARRLGPAFERLKAKMRMKRIEKK